MTERSDLRVWATADGLDVVRVGEGRTQVLPALAVRAIPRSLHLYDEAVTGRPHRRRRSTLRLGGWWADGSAAPRPRP